MHPVAKAGEEVLEQGLTLLAQVDETTYCKLVGQPYRASLGQHYRHVLDHFLCLMAGIKVMEIDYDRRARDPRLETNLEFARATTERLIRELRVYDNQMMERPCSVRYSVGYGDTEPIRLPSVIAREMAFCVGHAVHHYAIIRLLCAELGADLGPEFGIAPSTLKYRAALVTQ
jgi:hypothetical protein